MFRTFFPILNFEDIVKLIFRAQGWLLLLGLQLLGSMLGIKRW